MMLITTLCLAFAEDPDAQLQRSFEREFAYVQAEKRSLEQQISISKTSNRKQTSDLEQSILDLEGQLSQSKSQLLADNERFLALEKQVSSVKDIDSSFQTTLLQAAESLETPVGDSSSVDQFAALFDTMVGQIAQERSVRTEQGLFYTEDGSEIQGELLYIGQTATYGKSEQYTGALLPIGNGKFKVLPDVGAQTAASLFAKESPTETNVFLVEGFQKSIVMSEDRTIVETLQAGGIVAWVIAILGVLGLLLCALRSLILLRSPLSSLDGENILSQLKETKDVAVPLLSSIWTSPKSSHDALMDEAEAGILKEQEQLDRFGTAILVIAAIAPLLGLLGTVTGMISTFEIITEHGTGDPRMLSGGISEALITTQLGLVVAIPMVLLGNVLNGWAGGLSTKLEAVLLLIIAEKDAA